MDVTQEDVNSLAERLAALELPDGEREVLRVLAAAAAGGVLVADGGAEGADGAAEGEAEVSGFFFSENGHRSKETQLKSTSLDFGSMSLKLGPPSKGIVLFEESESV